MNEKQEAPKEQPKKPKEKSAVSWLYDFAEGYRPLYAVSIAAAVVGVVFAMLPYFIMAHMIAALVNGTATWPDMLRLGLLMALCWVLRIACHSVSTAFSHKATFQVLANIRRRICQKLIRVPLGYVKDTPSGSFKNILVERVDSIETILAHIVPEFTANLLAPVCIFVYLLTLDWRMALLSLVSLVLGMAAYMGMMIGYEKDFTNCVNKTKVLNDTAVEYINGIEVIKAFGKAKTSYERFVVAAKEGASCFVDWMRRCNVFFSIAMVLAPCTLISVLPAGALFVRGGSLALSDYIQCIVLSIGLVTPLITVMSYSDDIGKMGTVLGEVTGILTQPEQQRPETAAALPQGSAVSLQDVHFAYHDTEVLHGVNLDMVEGGVNALVGPSGSGKSTIAKLIAAQWDVSSGGITLGGVDIRTIPQAEYNKYIAYVSQDNYLFNETIRENIRMGRPSASDAEVEDIARQSGCYDFIMRLEHGFDTVVGDAGGHLSGGERQRVSIARAMLKDAPVIILDESTAYTDPESEAQVQASVAKLVQGKTLIVIAHRLSTVADADRIFVVSGGQIAAQGTHAQLLQTSPLYRQMWQAHISVKDTAEGGNGHA